MTREQLIKEVQYQINEFDISIPDAVENVADEHGLSFQEVLEAVGGRVKD